MIKISATLVQMKVKTGATKWVEGLSLQPVRVISLSSHYGCFTGLFSDCLWNIFDFFMEASSRNVKSGWLSSPKSTDSIEHNVHFIFRQTCTRHPSLRAQLKYVIVGQWNLHASLQRPVRLLSLLALSTQTSDSIHVFWMFLWHTSWLN